MSLPCQSKCLQPPAEAAFGTDLSLAELKQRIGSTGLDSDMYYYVVSTVKLAQGRFCQTGSAPNFQGGRLSLCTCKHRMRAVKQPTEWTNSWVAGFTGIREGGHNALFFLMQVEVAYPSFRELWNRSRLDAGVLAAKSSRNSKLGDFYEPLSDNSAEFSSEGYHPPMVGHVHENRELWLNDIRYPEPRTGRRPSLLLGKQAASFTWTKPWLIWPKARPEGKRNGIGRGHRRLPSLKAFLDQLRDQL